MKCSQATENAHGSTTVKIVIKPDLMYIDSRRGGKEEGGWGGGGERGGREEINWWKKNNECLTVLSPSQVLLKLAQTVILHSIFFSKGKKKRKIGVVGVSERERKGPRWNEAEQFVSRESWNLVKQTGLLQGPTSLTSLPQGNAANLLLCTVRGKKSNCLQARKVSTA